MLPETHVFHRGDHRQPTRRGRPRRSDDRRAVRGTVRGRSEGSRRCRPRAAGLPMRGTWSTAAIRSSAACWPTGSGCTTSAGDWSRRPATSAPGHAADAPGAARLAGLRAGAAGLEPEADAPADHDLGGLPPVVAPRVGRVPIPTTPGTADTRSDASMPRRCATACSVPADGSIRTLYRPRPYPSRKTAVGQVNAANDSPRRSLYLEVRRTRPVSFLTAFDAPVMAVNCDRRIPSTSAPAVPDADEQRLHPRSRESHGPPPASGSPARAGGRQARPARG